MKDKITATCFENTVELGGDFQAAKQVDKVYSNVLQAFEKAGDMPVKLRELYLENKDGLFVPVSLLNELRRLLYSSLSFDKVVPQLPLPQSVKKEKTDKKWSLKTDDYSLLKTLDLSSFDQIIFK